MQTITQLLMIILAIAVAYLLYRNIRHQPERFSREKLGKSTYTMGLLALVLIAFVSFLILLLRAG